MTGASLRKKTNKRSSPEPRASMASASSSFPSNYRNRSLFVMVFLVVSVVGLVGVSSSMWTGLGFAAHYDQICSVQVVNEFPHDPGAFTEGLLYGGNDTLFESTGLLGQSSVRQVALQTGKVQAHYKMDDSYFGEGLTLLGESMRNLLTRCKMVGVWQPMGKFFFGSDGTSILYQIDPQTLKVIQKHTVKYQDLEVHRLNELEYVNGEIWANVWGTDCIARISPEDGGVLGWILLPSLRQGLVENGHRNIDVLNGIAWDSERNRLFVTGKLWPKLYEIKLLPVTKPILGTVEQMCIQRPVQFGKP